MTKRATLLIIDDEIEILEIEEYKLSKEFNVITAHTFDQAMVILKQCSVDLIVSDFHLKMSNGLDFLKKVRLTNKTIPFVFLSGDFEYQNKFFSGTTELDKYCSFFSKPIEWTRLFESIRKALFLPNC